MLKFQLVDANVVYYVLEIELGSTFTETCLMPYKLEFADFLCSFVLRVNCFKYCLR
jgi:hypothetical protein